VASALDQKVDYREINPPFDPASNGY